MIYYKSHADQWNKSQFYLALNNNCRIIEIDLIYLFKNIYLSHSWRPFKFLTYGKVIKYFNLCKKYNGTKTLYLMIDIKTTNKKIIEILGNYIFQFANDKIIFLIRFDEKNKKRKKIAEEIYNAVKIFGNTQRYDKWINDIKVLEHDIEEKKLYKDLPLWKKINHF